MKNAILFLSVFLFFFSTCQLKNEPDKKDRTSKLLQIKTEKQTYRHSLKESIHTSAVNSSQQTLFYFSPAINATLQKYEAGQWVDLGPWYAVIAVVPEKIALAPGAQFPVIPLNSDHELLKKTGKYRICLNLFADQGDKAITATGEQDFQHF